MFTLTQLTKICGGELISASGNESVSAISIDSRSIHTGDLFIALQGEVFDGHNFVKEVFTKGASCVLVSRKPENISAPLILVSDTLKALHSIARFYRSQFAIPVVAVTGSVGKTTTKECIGVVLSQIFQTRAGFGNWNNHIGVPLNIFKLHSSDQCFVQELGANHPGEIRMLAEILQPTVGVITGVHPVHLEGFGSLDHVYRTKLELADYIEKVSGTLLVNGDDPELMSRLKNYKARLITFGEKPNNDYFLTSLTSRQGYVCFQVNRSIDFKLRGYGAFNAMNALAAVAVAGYFNLDLRELSETWESLPCIGGRFQVNMIDGIDVLMVNDAYNANPYSFGVALESFSVLANSRRKIVVVGDMLELGAESREYHENLGAEIGKGDIDYLIGMGPMCAFLVEAYRKKRGGGFSKHFLDQKG